MPWRESPTPYFVLVSELMLQQTQVARVVPKFEAFVYTYPDIASLGDARLADVLRLWSGLGYNRRAKFLLRAAQMICADHDGAVPQTIDDLVKLPGIGPNTAGAIMAYAHNEPVVYIETNIRTVLFHHFYPDTRDISDADLREVAAQVLDTEQPREWYWAMMDYGTYLKHSSGGRLDQSKHFVRQSPLSGSAREMRGRIIRSLVASPKKLDELRLDTDADERFDPALHALIAERMVQKSGEMIDLVS